MQESVFPTTLRTWIDRRLDEGKAGRLDANRYVMATYAAPLRIYYLGTNMRWLGEPDDVIGGFFEDRLRKADYFDRWQASGMRLRRWLINGFCFYLRELRRSARRDRTAACQGDTVTFNGDPAAVVDREAARAFVSRAIEQTQQACLDEGLETHWRIFLRHHVDHAPFAAIAGEFDVDPARAAVMSRTARRKFHIALVDVLTRDGVAREEMNREIQWLLEAIGR